MTHSRFSIGWLMLAVAIIGFHLAIVCADPPVFGLEGLEVGLLPGVTMLTLTLFSGDWRGEKNLPFARGFVACLAVAICVYLVCCVTIPDLLRWPAVYYVNEIEPDLYDADLSMVYRLSLEIQGLVLGVPQLLFALGGGVAIRELAARRAALDARHPAA